ncbi:hypothetical protein ACFU7X_41005 [Streptomyces chartreusis]|uniref:hypothetical protein n=1 Tax=Streptomyces chartreusis TaxID=1969 RepID=UPI0036B6BE86
MNVREPLYGAAADRVRDELTAGGSLPPAVTELLAAIVEALDVPIADRPADDKQRAELLTQRASDARVLLSSLLAHGDVARAARRLREWTAEHPVTFPTWQARTVQAVAEETQLLADGEEGWAPMPTPGGDQRCPAAHPQDPDPCSGPAVVTILDRTNGGADGCEHHGARMLASLEGGRVYALPDAPEGAAIRTFKAAATTLPYAWVKRGEGQ